ncbi:MAG: ABC transporter permease subunit [Clostridia bacterium]|nr:ABC transporter permease subunit [Clostridia bacterium]MBQ9129929.1 ABC transporter permease subunit [Clostridia bacterium]
MLAIFKRELRSYFSTPIGYVFIAVFMAISGVVFALSTYMADSASLSTYFTMMTVAYVLLIPILTMKIFSDELRSKTDQLLLTAPVSITGVVFAKYLAALAMYMIAVALSMVNFLFMVFNGYTVQPGIAIGMFVGMILIGMACIAVGIFVSSLTESQLVAVLVTIVVLVVMMFINIFNQFIPFAWLRTVLSWLAISSRYDTLAAGRFDFTAILYYVSIAGSFLLLTIRVFEKKRWH